MKLYTFLNEYNVEKPNQDEIANILLTNCKNALSLFKKNIKLYKGTTRHRSKFLYIKKNLNSLRKSRNTSNFYTNFINYDKNWKSFPKRQFIFSNNYYTSYEFASSSNGMYFVFPFDNEKIGICPAFDIWFSFINIKSIDSFFNSLSSHLTPKKLNFGEVNNIKDFDSMLDLLDEELKNDNDFLTSISKSWKLYTNKEYMKNKSFRENFLTLIDPTKNNFELIDDIKFLQKRNASELWCDGSVVLVNTNQQEWLESLVI